jgi:hypothetical protein
MNISSESVSRLCDSVVQALFQWVAFQPALQGGGFERSSQGTLERVISEWLDPRFAVLPEYKRRGFLHAQHHGVHDLGASPCEISEPAMRDVWCDALRRRSVRRCAAARGRGPWWINAGVGERARGVCFLLPARANGVTSYSRWPHSA